MPLDLSPALSEVFLFIAGLGLLLLGAFRDEEAARILTPLTGLTLVVAALMVLGQDKARIVGLGGHFVFDGYAAFLKVVIFAGAGVAIMMARGYMADQRIDRFEYPILALFSALDFARFDEERFWRDYQWLLDQHPAAGLERYRAEFERRASPAEAPEAEPT